MEETRLQAGAARDDSMTTPEQVAAYLARNPEFLSHHPDLVDQMSPPDRSRNGGAVVDLQKVMVDRLRGEVDNLRDCAQSLIETSRENLLLQSRTHSAVITLLSATTLQDGAQVVVDDLAAILNLDVAAVGFEGAAFLDPNVRVLPDGCVDRLLGEHREIRLVAEAKDDGTVFGDKADQVQSCALVRLHVYNADGVNQGPGVLALGSTEAGLFQPGQGTDLISFLARALEKCAGRWTARA